MLNDDTPKVAHITLRLPSMLEQRVRMELGALGVSAEPIRARELSTQLPRSDFLLVGRPPRLDWSPASRLRLIQVPGVGIDPLLPAEGLGQATQIAKTRAGHEAAVRDHALALLLALCRGLPAALDAQRRRQWEPRPCRPLHDQRLTVVGLGGLGSRIASAAQRLGLVVTGVCRQPRAFPGLARVLPPSRLHEALRGADHVVLCLPLTAQSAGMIDGEALAQLPEHATLINVARGGIVDERALMAALRSGKLAGAAFDVFAHEPLPPDSPLWSCPGLIITPHTAGYTPDYLDRVIDRFIDNVRRVLAGQPVLDPVSREHGY